MGPHYLDQLFTPAAIAVFGANQRSDSVAGRVFDNLSNGSFEGPVYAINPKHKSVYGRRCYSTLREIGEPIDLAVIATPARSIPKIIDACGKYGVRAAVVISAGFNPGDNRGKSLKKAMLKAARAHQMRLLGPNCLGLLRPGIGMNASFSKSSAAPGQLALVSQSGALCTSILDWASVQEIGFSAIVSLGNAADIDFGDLLDYLGQDPDTKSILLYVEGIRDARSFLSGLRIAARMKPVVMIKSGRHVEGSRAAVTHTGALVGADDVFDAALQRAGVVRAMTVEQLFSAAQLLATRYRVNGNRLAVITNGGGLGVMAIDRAIDLNVDIARLSAESIKQLNEYLPPQWSCTNPIDLLGDASAALYQVAVSICLQDPGVDGVLVMLSPQAMTDPLACAQAAISARKGSDKPVLACWMGSEQVESANRRFAKHRLPFFPNPESSVEAFAYLATYHRNQQLLKQVPGPLEASGKPDIDGARKIIRSVLGKRRSVMTSTESKALLRTFFVPVNESIECSDAEQALLAANRLGYPVAIKIRSKDISHKSDVGGVRLNIENEESLRQCFDSMLKTVCEKAPEAEIAGVSVESMYTQKHGRELLIGVISDPVFGPVITFGAGGIQVEVLRDRAVAIPPLNRFLAKKMIGQTKVAGLLGEFRNMPAIDSNALIQVLQRVSEMVCELPEITALDINPLIADNTGVVALDARIVVEKREASPDRYAHMAIHPYPTHLEQETELRDGSRIRIRPIRPEDASIEQSFVRELSQESRYFRFMHALNELTEQMLVRLTQLDYNRELALIAVCEVNGSETELGVARYSTNADGESCEFALVVADKWQNRGLGTRLMNALIDAARQHGLKRMTGEVLTENRNMRQLVGKLGFSVDSDPEDAAIVQVSLTL